MAPESSGLLLHPSSNRHASSSPRLQWAKTRDTGCLGLLCSGRENGLNIEAADQLEQDSVPKTLVLTRPSSYSSLLSPYWTALQEKASRISQSAFCEGCHWTPRGTSIEPSWDLDEADPPTTRLSYFQGSPLATLHCVFPLPLGQLTGRLMIRRKMLSPMLVHWLYRAVSRQSGQDFGMLVRAATYSSHKARPLPI
ncbi:hypothetical protein BBK36DRAFT_16118 [Trichoderma citrinoviride]|uniref:Uncharacterized protein n=1 Tax=Trichoderma citrinoviride TaxID=58853 RepID=A0A2T4BMA2_9HYPO|nr:hypothetical protein BBK36DRAFT_16118 [Trichoderma citrinoviride]PTB70443.1 hypothetical protein BBK36DRAFT_16118 [Trichoderma citrinoviride]